MKICAIPRADSSPQSCRVSWSSDARDKGAVDLLLLDDYGSSGDADDLHIGAGSNQALAQFQRSWRFADNENVGAREIGMVGTPVREAVALP